VGSMEKLAEKTASTMMQSMREWQATHPCQRIARKFEEVGYIMIMHGSRLDLDMMHSWKESSCCKTGGYVSSFHHWIPSPKKITAIHDISFVFMHMGWLAWIAVMMRFWRQIVWTVNKVQAFSAAIGICGCNYRRAQVLHL
jgi:hypothetical protein